MIFRHTNRPGFLLGFVDFFTAGLFFLLYMPLGGLQEEILKTEISERKEKLQKLSVSWSGHSLSCGSQQESGGCSETMR